MLDELIAIELEQVARELALLGDRIHDMLCQVIIHLDNGLTAIICGIGG